MRTAAVLLLFVAIPGCEQAGHVTTLADFSLRDIEQLSFEDAYKLWTRECSVQRNTLPGSPVVMTSGFIDSQTRRFTPANSAALECRLGQLCDQHLDFLSSQLKVSPDVHRLLEASPRLCELNGIQSVAAVRLLPDGTYQERIGNGYSQTERQRLWLQAFDTTGP
jgi:hypothetical protein